MNFTTDFVRDFVTDYARDYNLTIPTSFDPDAIVDAIYSAKYPLPRWGFRDDLESLDFYGDALLSEVRSLLGHTE